MYCRWTIVWMRPLYIANRSVGMRLYNGRQTYTCQCKYCKSVIYSDKNSFWFSILFYSITIHIFLYLSSSSFITSWRLLPFVTIFLIGYSYIVLIWITNQNSRSLKKNEPNLYGVSLILQSLWLANKMMKSSFRPIKR